MNAMPRGILSSRAAAAVSGLAAVGVSMGANITQLARMAALFTDGGSGTLRRDTEEHDDHAAELRGGAVRALSDGEPMQLARSARWFGQHVLAPREGVAVHVNAFNFPAWGFAEKAAVALLAGMPVITKPATATALLTYRMMELIVESK